LTGRCQSEKKGGEELERKREDGGSKSTLRFVRKSRAANTLRSGLGFALCEKKKGVGERVGGGGYPREEVNKPGLLNKGVQKYEVQSRKEDRPSKRRKSIGRVGMEVLGEKNRHRAGTRCPFENVRSGAYKGRITKKGEAVFSNKKTARLLESGG